MVDAIVAEERYNLTVHIKGGLKFFWPRVTKETADKVKNTLASGKNYLDDEDFIPYKQVRWVNIRKVGRGY